MVVGGSFCQVLLSVLTKFCSPPKRLIVGVISEMPAGRDLRGFENRTMDKRPAEQDNRTFLSECRDEQGGQSRLEDNESSDNRTFWSDNLNKERDRGRAFERGQQLDW